MYSWPSACMYVLQVLARFEGFPSKKLEALRTAAALYSKLDGATSRLKCWKLTAGPSRRSSTESRATSTRSVHCCTSQWPLENAWWYERCSSVRVRLRAGQRRRGHGGAEQRGGDEAAAVPWRPLRLQRMLTFNGVNSESNRVLDCGTNAHFQWYFMARRTFGGIFRFSHSFDAMKPIFPI